MKKIELTVEEMTYLIRQTVRNTRFRWISTLLSGKYVTGLAADGYFFYCK